MFLGCYLSELEIDERLNITGLYLNDHIDDYNQQQGLSYKRKACNCTLAGSFASCRKEVKNISQQHECEYGLISFNQLAKQLRLEVGEYLGNHRP